MVLLVGANVISLT